MFKPPLIALLATLSTTVAQASLSYQDIANYMDNIGDIPLTNEDALLK